MPRRNSTKQGRRLTELRQSNAAGKHGDRRLKRQRDRSARERYEVEDQWESYDEE